MPPGVSIVDPPRADDICLRFLSAAAADSSAAKVASLYSGMGGNSGIGGIGGGGGELGILGRENIAPIISSEFIILTIRLFLHLTPLPTSQRSTLEKG